MPAKISDWFSAKKNSKQNFKLFFFWSKLRKKKSMMLEFNLRNFLKIPPPDFLVKKILASQGALLKLIPGSQSSQKGVGGRGWRTGGGSG